MVCSAVECRNLLYFSSAQTTLLQWPVKKLTQVKIAARVEKSLSAISAHGGRQIGE